MSVTTIYRYILTMNYHITAFRARPRSGFYVWLLMTTLFFASVVNASESTPERESDSQSSLPSLDGIQVAGSFWNPLVENGLLLLQCFFPGDHARSRSLTAADCCQAMDQATSWYLQRSDDVTRHWETCQEQDLIDTQFLQNHRVHTIPHYQRIITLSEKDLVQISSSSSNTTIPVRHFVWSDTMKTATDLAIPSASDTQFTLSSTLSDSGGMHRDFRHSMTIHSTNSEQNETIHLVIQVHIPRDLFINIEDAFVVHNLPINFQLDLVSNKDIVIDQEEPTFVSPHHIVYYTVRGPTSSIPPRDAEKPLQIEWTTLLHVRYPMPQNTEMYTTVRMVKPFVITAKPASDRQWMLPQEPLIEFQVANGLLPDLIPVVFVCVMAAIGGTWALLREVHRYSTCQ